MTNEKFYQKMKYMTSSKSRVGLNQPVMKCGD